MSDIERQKEPKLPDWAKGEVIAAFDRSKEKPPLQIDVSKYRQYIKTLPGAVIAISYLLYKEGKKEFTASDIVQRTRFFFWVKHADNLHYIQTILAILARNGLLKRVRRGVYTFAVNVNEIKRMYPEELASKYYYTSSNGQRKEHKEKKKNTGSKVDPYQLLLVLKGKKPADNLSEPYRLIVEFMRKPVSTLKKLSGFKQLIEDGILEVEVKFKVKL